MPFKSATQRRFMWAKHPDMAREFESKTPKGAKLPERKTKRDKWRESFMAKKKRKHA